MPMMGGVNLPQIEIATFDGIILNWWEFWERFQATICDKQHMGDPDMLTAGCTQWRTSHVHNSRTDTEGTELWRSHQMS